jgi:hypothetical protein
MKKDLTLPCLFFMFITIYLYYHSKTNDKYLLLFGILGQILLLIGSLIKNDNLISISHVMYTFILVFGIFIFKEKYNKYFVLFLLLSTFFTRYYYSGCLFLMANDNKSFLPLNINYDPFRYILLLVILYKLNI